MSPRSRHALTTHLCCMAVAASAVAGCGYAPAHRPQRGFCVSSGESRAADAVAASALASGVRHGLASAGALGTCPPATLVRVEIVRIDSTPTGAVEGEGSAIARGMLVSVAARATAQHDDGEWVAEVEGATSIEVSPSLMSAAQTEADGRARAAWQAGLGLAARLTSQPDPSHGAQGAR